MNRIGRLDMAAMAIVESAWAVLDVIQDGVVDASEVSRLRAVANKLRTQANEVEHMAVCVEEARQLLKLGAVNKHITRRRRDVTVVRQEEAASKSTRQAA